MISSVDVGSFAIESKPGRADKTIDLQAIKYRS